MLPVTWIPSYGQILFWGRGGGSRGREGAGRFPLLLLLAVCLLTHPQENPDVQETSKRQKLRESERQIAWNETQPAGVGRVPPGVHTLAWTLDQCPVPA